MTTHPLLIAGLALSASLAAPALAAQHPTGIDFLHKAIEGDNSEITLGGVAAQRGARPDVRAFGRMLQTDHRKARTQAAAVAHRLHSYVPQSMSAEAIREKGKLSRLSGRDFDHEFASYMVDDHRKDIADFEAEAAATDKPALVSLARKSLLVLQKHLTTAESLTR